MTRVTKTTASNLASAFAIYYHARVAQDHAGTLASVDRLVAAQKASGVTMVDDEMLDLAVKMAKHFLSRQGGTS